MFLAILDPVTMELWERAQRGATNVLAAWVDTDNCEALYRTWEPVEAMIRELVEEIDDYIDIKNITRHCEFISRELRREDKDACRTDIINIACTDLMAIRKELEERAEASVAFDSKLFGKTANPLADREFDDAIRVAFPVLSQRLRKLGGSAAAKIDGWQLVDLLFGKTGTLRAQMGTKECNALHSLLNGLYSAFRNRHVHHLPGVYAPEGLGLVLMIHYLLREVLKPKSKWTVNP